MTWLAPTQQRSSILSRGHYGETGGRPLPEVFDVAELWDLRPYVVDPSRHVERHWEVKRPLLQDPRA